MAAPPETAPPAPLRGRLPWLLLALALLVNLGAARAALLAPVAGNDMLISLSMVDAAARSFEAQGWAALQDPWTPNLGGGYPIFRSYGGLPHRGLGLLSAGAGIPAEALLLFSNAAVAAFLPLLVFFGGRWLGLARLHAAASAFVFATLRTADHFGHGPLEGGFAGQYGMWPQFVAMALATLALPACFAAVRPDGAGLKRLPASARMLLAGLLLSLVVRSHLVTTVNVGAMLAVLLLADAAQSGRGRTELAGRVARLAGVGLVAAALSGAFLVTFAGDLPVVADDSLEPDWKMRSIGLLPVLGRLLGGWYLDGGSFGPWTSVLLGGVLLWGWSLGPGRAHAPTALRPLGFAALVAVALLAGRTTWGTWVDHLPILGRFHDHRYLLSLHLVAPWLVGVSAVELWARARRRDERWADLGGAGLLALAALLHLGNGVLDEQAREQALEQSQALQGLWPGGLERALDSEPMGAFVRVGPSHPVASLTAAEGFRRGLAGRDDPRVAFALNVQFLTWWAGWLKQPARLEGDLQPDDLRVAGVSHWVSGHGGPQRVQRAVRGSGWLGDSSLVRSDLLVRAEHNRLDGLAVAWFLSGAHRVRQHPAVALAGHEPAGDHWSRAVPLDPPRPEALANLPGAPGGEGLGELLALERGDGPFDRRALVRAGPGAWLMLGVSWHPGWQARVDGHPADVALLLPGFAGVAVPPGEHTVELMWPVAPWRGWAAAANALACAAIFAFVVGSRRRAAVDPAP